MDSPWPQQSRYYILSWLGTPRTLRVCGGPFFILVTNSHNLSVYGLPLKQAIKIRQLADLGPTQWPLRVCGGPFFIFVTNLYNMVVYGLPWPQQSQESQMKRWRAAGTSFRYKGYENGQSTKQKVCKTTTFRHYLCFSLHLLRFLLSKAKRS